MSKRELRRQKSKRIPLLPLEVKEVLLGMTVIYPAVAADHMADNLRNLAQQRPQPTWLGQILLL